MPNGLLFVISGPSGVGKTTLLQTLIPRWNSLYANQEGQKGLEFSVSYTTRAPRAMEENGRDYFFVTPEKFQQLIAGQEFLEHALVHGHRYGTSKSFVEQRLGQGINVVLDVDVQGALNVKKAIPPAILIFIAPPSFSEMVERLTKRGTEKAESLQQRIQDASWELEQMVHFDFLLENAQLSRAEEDLFSILRSENLRIVPGSTLLQKYMPEKSG
ncbi:MAG TPA: guanylate kinase [Thermotogota bacterium]|nr:guanylate kinase [Thermotogota bacterium]HRW92158.1 guanylate kinase [Thermotogota bacterium]